MDTDVLEFIELSVSFLTKELFVLFNDCFTCSAKKVHSCHTVVTHSCVKRMIQSLSVHSYTFNALFYKPFTSVDTCTSCIMIVSFRIIEVTMHSRVQAKDFSFQITIFKTVLFHTCIKMFVCDQSPRLDIDFENDSLSSVSISRHLMCVTSTSAIELILHNVTWCITVCTCMHCTCNSLCKNATFSHRMCAYDFWFIKVRPTRNLCTKRMC